MTKLSSEGIHGYMVYFEVVENEGIIKPQTKNNW